jgi:hypothetical protein
MKLMCCVALVILALCPLAGGSKAAQRSSTRQTTEHDTQCDLCKQWFSFQYYKFHHEPKRNCIPPQQVLHLPDTCFPTSSSAGAAPDAAEMSVAAPSSPPNAHHEEHELAEPGMDDESYQAPAVATNTSLPSTLIPPEPYVPETYSPKTALQKKVDTFVAEKLSGKGS